MKKKLFDNVYLSSLCMEIGLILKSGISVNEGFLLVTEDEADSERKAVLLGIFDSLELGEELGNSMEKSEAFPKYMVDMIRIGEKTGSLESVFKGLSAYYDRQESISSSIRHAVIYPAILFTMMVVVIGVLVVEVLPIFNDVFAQLGSVMSPMAMFFLKLGEGIRAGRFVILGLLILVIAFCLAVIYNESVKEKVTRFFGGFMSKTNLGREIATARFASAMAMGLAAALDMDSSLEMAEKLNFGSAISERIANCRNLISEGKSFFEAVGETGLFSPLHSRMLSIGVKAGAADVVMEEIARRTENEANEGIDRVIGKVEPILVVVMSLLVGLVLLSVMLPLMGIMSSIG